MGSVVKFPGVPVDYDPNELDPKDADVISVCPMDVDMIPLYEYETDKWAWWGVVGFWHIRSDLNIRLLALFKDKRDAVMYAIGKNERVEPDMPEDTVGELRMALLQEKGAWEDDPIH